jgi:hypothetical protein
MQVDRAKESQERKKSAGLVNMRKSGGHEKIRKTWVDQEDKSNQEYIGRSGG